MAIDPNTQYTISGDQLDDLAGYVKDATEMPSTLLGTTAPTTSTVGNVGQTYLDKTTNKLYVCTAKSNNYYTWNLARVGSNIIMTDTDPGEGDPLADDTYKAYYGGSPLFMDYSTLEQDTGATWIDGKVIYKKTVDTGALPNITTKTVAHNISNLGTVVDFYGVAYNPNTKLRIKTDYPYTEYAVRTSVNDTYINISTAADQSSFTQSYVTVYYTKSS